MITKYIEFIKEKFDLVVHQREHAKGSIDDPSTYKNLWPKLDEINGDLSKEQIIYALSELIDDDVIEVLEVKKTYRLSTSKSIDDDTGLEEIKRYLDYKINVKVQIKKYKTDTEEEYEIKKARYVNYRDTTFNEIMRDVYSHRLLNKSIYKLLIAGEYKYFDTHRGVGIDEFDLWSNALWLK